MAFPVTLNGRTYTLTDFEGTNYVDGLPDAFEDFVTHAGDIYNSTSTTSNSIGTGSKTFTVEANKPYQAGTPLRIADAAAPSTNFLDTVVTSYSGTTLVVNSIGYGGSGTKTSWTVNIGGAKTIDGTLGLSQGGTGATTAAAARTNLDTYSKTEADSRFLNVSGEASNVTMTGDLTVDTNTLFVDSSTNRVGVGTLTPAEELDVSGDAPSVQLSSTNASGRNYGLQSTNAGVFALYDGTAGANRIVVSSGGDVAVGTNATNPVGHSKNNFSIADYSSNGFGSITIGGSTALSGGNIGLIDFYNDTAAGPDDVIARISVNRGDSNDSGDLRITTVNAGVESLNALFPEEGGAIFNGSSRADGDFRVEGDALTHALFVDSTNSYVGVGESVPAAPLHVSTTAQNTALFDSNHVSGTSLFIRNSNSSVDSSAMLGFAPANDISGVTITAIAEEDFSVAANRTARLEIDTRDNGNFQNRLTLSRTEAVFNDDSDATDFRVASDSRTHTLFVDASTSTVNIDQSANFHGNRLNIEKSDDPDDGPEIVLKNIYRSGTTTAGELGSITFGSWRDVASAGSYVASISGHNISYPGSSGQLRFHTRSSGNTDPADVRQDAYERMRIVQDGDIYFGTTSGLNGTSKFHFKGSETGGGTGIVGIFNENTASGADNSPLLTLNKARTTTSSTARFVQFYADDTAQPMGGIVGNGATNVQFASISDERLKENISSISGSLAKINNLRPVEFDLIGSGEHVPAGFIAQEVETVFPEYVIQNMSNGDDDARKGITGGMSAGFVAHLVQAIKELSAKNDALQARITALESN